MSITEDECKYYFRKGFIDNVFDQRTFTYDEWYITGHYIPYICNMKNFHLKRYKHVVFLVWLMIVTLFWIQYFSMTVALEATAFAACIFIPTILITNYLSNNLLPKSIHEKKMPTFSLYFIGYTLLISFIHFCVFVLFYHLEQSGVFDYSGFLNINNSLLIEYITTIPAVIIIMLGFCGLRFYYEHTKLEEVHLKAQLQILQQQINPHFMFNVLNHIYILMQKDVGRASDLLVKYSEILRYQLYNGKKEVMTLGEEVQFLKDMIGVEKTRWGEDLTVDCKWDIEDVDRKLPPLILITFIENAFKHVSRSITDKGYIKISLNQKRDNLHLEVENSKSKKQVKKEDSSGLGLRNIIERLDILYPQKHKLEIKETDQIYIIRLSITL